ncbi:MAG: diguanylate cyclase (GGDEF)-like protein [Flavobacteriales bacterium]|jgi:diguanylate cyclase (GGDEF)-like protein
MNILIVEDSKTLLAIMQRYVTDAGHTAIIAENGETAVQLTTPSTVDMIIMDVEMPGLDGFETTRLIRENLVDEWIPIIFVTGMNEDANYEEGIEAGGDDYLIKPISETILRAKIRAMERIAKMRSEMRELNKKLTRLSQRDSLTDLYNRRVFEEKLEIAWRQATRSGEPLAILIMDIDHFKLYNDYYGHVEGDECIRKVAKALRHSMKRPNDIIARYGGEEFICLLPNTNREGAMHIAEYIRNNILALEIEHKTSDTDRRVSVSIGGNIVRHTTGIDYEEQITLADNALYESKREGRNRTTITEFENVNTVLVITRDAALSSTVALSLSGHCKVVRLPELALNQSPKFTMPALIILDVDDEYLLKEYLIFSAHFNISATPILIITNNSAKWDRTKHEEIYTLEVLDKTLTKYQLVSQLNTALGIHDKY